MPKELRNMFANLENLIRLLIILPSSSCEAERSFSCLRRLKNYLRNTMTQKRLNHLAICNVHKEQLDDLNINEIAFKFIDSNERRKQIFRNFL